MGTALAADMHQRRLDRSSTATKNKEWIVLAETRESRHRQRLCLLDQISLLNLFHSPIREWWRW